MMLSENCYKLFAQTIIKPLKHPTIYIAITGYCLLENRFLVRFSTITEKNLFMGSPNFVNLSQSYKHQLTKQSKS